MTKYAISSTGAWLFEGGHKFDALLAEAVADTLHYSRVQSVLDIGCGDGTYTRFLLDCGFQVQGYDGNPKTELITGNLGKVADFSVPQHLGRFDAVLCLEVGEHIPAQFEGVFLDNLTRHATKLIIMSWAVPGQGGHGHVNERSNDWVVDEMDDRGWPCEPAALDHLRANVSNCYWFRDTVMVFSPYKVR